MERFHGVGIICIFILIIQMNRCYMQQHQNVEVRNESSVQFKPLYDVDNAYQTPAITKYRLVMEAKQVTKLIKCNIDYAPVFREYTLNDVLGEFHNYIFYDEENKIIKTDGFTKANSTMITEY